MSAKRVPHIEPGSRVVVAGRTGSGKTTLGAFLLGRSRQHWIIFNPKHTAGYSVLDDANVLRKTSGEMGRVESSLKKHRFTVLNFPSSESDSEYMDALIQYFHETYTNIGVCADELYTLHSNGRPGNGLIALLTRGRELKQSFLGMTQRPAWVSRFVFSEASAIVGMDLALPEDRKRMRDNTGSEVFSSRVPPHHWRWYNVGADSQTLWGPVPFKNPDE